MPHPVARARSDRGQRFKCGVISEEELSSNTTFGGVGTSRLAWVFMVYVSINQQSLSCTWMTLSEKPQSIYI